VLTSAIAQVVAAHLGAPLEARYNPASTAKFGDIGISLHHLDDSFLAEREWIDALSALPVVREVRVVGQFLNVTLDRSAAIEYVLGRRLVPEDNAACAPVLLEHTSINPNAAPHVGRARNAILGDSIARILRSVGAEVERRYFVNDFGKQIGLLMVALGPRGVKGVEFSSVLAKYIEINERAKEDPEIGEKALELLGRAEAGDDAVLESLRSIAKHSLAGQIEILARLGISFDEFDFETELLGSKEIDEVEVHLRARGASFVDDDGRLVVDLSKLGYEHDAGRYIVLRRANGSSMYALRDLAYNIRKARWCKGGRNIVVLGEDHKAYMEQIGLILSSIGYEPPEQIYYSYVVLRDGKMSTRRGNVVLLDEFIDLAVRSAELRLREANLNMEAADRRAIADQVAVAAVRFSLLKSAPNSSIVFDLDAATRLEGATGPYLQYTAVRCHALLAKAANVPRRERESISSPLWEIVKIVDEYATTLQRSAERLEPHLLSDYLLRLAKVVNRFYNAERVITAGTADRLAVRVLERVTQILDHGLELQGIEVPEGM